ncbi:MAG: UDP-N-acetylmuramate dehydrogenase [Acidimicrobiales bacterium]|nr:UDP-N-acetylmuramate dehydrogenase [Acidimicrobiales bacterium]MYD33621.1 UDP-N-acetylmuramate dehydrogenase [Acidimicrobiales bacterium]MYI10675.1 UDP-N-acetylmuramate dehydrogenase [Acidimicrobiales bacterium]
MSPECRSPGSWSNPDAVQRAVAVLGDAARVDAPLGALTTSRVGGPAAVAYVANGMSDLQRAAEAAGASGLEILVVGRGSNLLVADRGFEGIALFLGDAYAKIEFDSADATVTAGASVALPVLARQCAAAGLGGLEWAVGVPGSVGGAVRMNAGGHGSDMASCLIDADIVDLEAGTGAVHDVSALNLKYRSSGLQNRHVVVRARLSGRQAPPSTVTDQIADIVRWRREHQPGGQNSGSVFMNPPLTSTGTVSAGAHIDQTGLRGLRMGTAEVSRLHANFIVSDPGGTAADVVALMAEIRRRVAESTGIVLQPEVRMVGFEATPTPS